MYLFSSPATVKTRQLAGEGGENKLSQQEIDAVIVYSVECIYSHFCDFCLSQRHLHRDNLNL